MHHIYDISKNKKIEHSLTVQIIIWCGKCGTLKRDNNKTLVLSLKAQNTLKKSDLNWKVKAHEVTDG